MRSSTHPLECVRLALVVLVGSDFDGSRVAWGNGVNFTIGCTMRGEEVKDKESVCFKGPRSV